MHLVIFGLTVTSSWGNGHATLWRGLLKALARRGHTVTFYERDLPFYAEARDMWMPPKGVDVRLYSSFEEIRATLHRELQRADAALVTSYCPDAIKATDAIVSAERPLAIFYDLDTPVTLDALRAGAAVPYLPSDGLHRFDLVLSYTGGLALEELQTRLGARRVAPLYGWVDPDQYRPVAPAEAFRCALNYLGTYAADRQPAVEEFLLRPAQHLPDERFTIGGAQYPEDFPWARNIHFVRHLEPAQHPSFFCSARATLNVTRRAMAEYGYCPSGRLFEAAACGTPILTDTWNGLGNFFESGMEILPVRTFEDVLNHLSLSDGELRRVGDAARARVLRDHTADARADTLERLLHESLATRTPVANEVASLVI